MEYYSKYNLFMYIPRRTFIEYLNTSFLICDQKFLSKLNHSDSSLELVLKKKTPSKQNNLNLKLRVKTLLITYKAASLIRLDSLSVNKPNQPLLYNTSSKLLLLSNQI